MSRPVSKYLCQYFDEDLVYQVSPGGRLQIGVVVESNENSDSDDDEEEGSETMRSKLEPGKAKIAWYPRGNSQVLREKKVELYDRSLLPGDVLKRMNVEGGQRGVVCNSNVQLTCKVVGTNHVITGVKASDFVCTTDLAEDVIFFYGNWIGYIEDVKCRVVLSLENGSLISMEEDELIDFRDVTSERSRKSEFDDSTPYVGQKLTGSKYLFHDSDFVYKSEDHDSFYKNGKSSKFVLTVVQVNLDQIEAHWLCCVSSDMPGNEVVKNDPFLVISQNSIHERPPPTRLRGPDLKKIVQLNYFRRGNIEMADRGMYTLKDCDQVMSYNDWCLKTANDFHNRKLGLDQMTQMSTNEEENDDDFIDVSSDENNDFGSILSLANGMRPRRKLGMSIRRIRRKRLRASKSKKFSESPMTFALGDQVPVEVVATRTFVDIVWQDGKFEPNCPSTNFYPIHHLDGHEYFPGDFVVKSSNEFSHNSYGVIQNVDHSERTARVRWLKVVPNKCPEFVSEEEVSVYDLEDHPDFSLRPGSCVVRLPGQGTEKLSAASRAGQVVALKTSGRLECVWADGSRSEIDPQELYIIGDYDSDDLWADDSSDDYETVSAASSGSRTPPSAFKKTPKSASPSNKENKESDKELIDRLRKAVDGLEDWFTQFPTLNNQNGHVVVRKLTLLLDTLKAIDGQMSTSLTTLRDVQVLLESVRLPEGISGRTSHINRKLSKLVKSVVKMANGIETPENLDEEEFEEMDTCEAVSSPISTKTKNSLEILQKLKTQLFTVCPVAESREEKCVEPSDPAGLFQHVEHVPDTHKFKLSLFQAANMRLFSSRVKKEIDILRTSLPKDILVKSYEDRMDLFSVLIKGPVGTPYEDGLFLFDVQLPGGYPSVPPLVHYITFCRDRLNPNLYEGGKVCVSLLGTWSGKGSEVWSPIDSNLLQLFISIQGLILVPEPYFNEAGYTRQKGTSSGDENSRLYNEMAVVKVVESMARMTSSPSEPFREEILAHVRSTSTRFVSRLESWIRISRSGPLEAAGDVKLDFPLLPASKGFCLSLESALISFRKVLSSI